MSMLIIVAIFLVVIVILFMRIHAKIVMRFYRDTCGYCRASQAEWDKYKSKNAINPFVRCVDIDTSTNRGKKLMEVYDIGGVPNIIKIDDFFITQYKGDRSAEDIARFVSM